MELPATHASPDGGNYPSAGYHLFKVDDAVVGAKKKDNVTPILDKNGNPAVRIIFKCQVVNAEGEKEIRKIDCIFFYSPLPPSDPRRDDPTKNCPSEWVFSKMKKAFGFPLKKSIGKEEIEKGMAWGMVVDEVNVDRESGEMIATYQRLKNDGFRPYIESMPTKGKPEMDPKLFTEKKLVTKREKDEEPEATFTDTQDELGGDTASATESLSSDVDGDVPDMTF